MKKIILILVAVLLLASFTGCDNASTLSGEKIEGDIKIGFIGPLTGEYANYGVTMSQAVQVAIDEKNAEGGIAGRSLVMVAEDSEGKPEKAGAAIQKLSSLDKIAGMVGCVFSGSSLQVAPRADAEQIVMISPSSTHPELPAIGEYIFRDVANDNLQAEVFGRYAYHNLGLKNIAVLYIKNDYSQGLANSFKETFEAEGGTIVAMESGVQGDKDFKTQLTKIKGENPDALFIPNYVAEIALMLKQADQLGITAQMLSADGISNPDIFELAGDLADGVIFSGPEMGDNPLASAFASKYESRYGIAPDSFTLNSYDAANIIIDALEATIVKAEEKDDEGNSVEIVVLDRAAVREKVAAITDYAGVSGEFSFAADGDVIKNIAILSIENGAYTQSDVLRIEDGKLVSAK